MNNPLFVTKVHLPPLSKYKEYLDKIWESGHITNNGPFVRELESKLSDRFSSNVNFVNNGTIALQIAIKALDLHGEIITTPFSYVATTSSIVWENCKPKFVDIDPDYLCIDADKIEEAITENTSAILATHVFGNPCDVIAIESIAKKYNLKVIYDAAHAFDVQYLGKPLVSYGDISTVSFHATKVFHTAEGGAVITNDEELNFKIKYLRNFGHDGPLKFHGIGINAKCSEIHAAMGLSMLHEMDGVIESRQKAYTTYKELLKGQDKLKCIPFRDEMNWNYSYFPVLIENENLLTRLLDFLETKNIYPRRYFYPSLNKLPYVDGKSCSISENISSRIICLPFHAYMPEESIERTVEALKYFLNPA